METLLTEELDGRLRAHRTRAGRIEEEVGSEPLLEGMHMRCHPVHGYQCRLRCCNFGRCTSWQSSTQLSQ
jgi:hypothetical protein